jgi:DNA-binding NarL/FixJ family response regulator
MAIKAFLATSHVILLDSLQVLLEGGGEIKVIGKATSGHGAVTRIQKLRPDVAILDIGLTEQNGIEVTSQMRVLSPMTRVVILSTRGSSEHVYRALKAGARGFLPKEASGAEVLEAVKTVCKGKRYLSTKVTTAIIDDYIDENRSTSPLDSLTVRERQVLQLVVEGKSSAQTADLLSLSPKTVESYRSRIRQKLGIHDLPGLVKFAIRLGVTSLD